MSRLLLLVHRIPFPPNKGDKIRSYHLLRHLAGRHEVFLGAFVDDPQDWKYEAELDRLCRQVKLVDLDPTRRKLASLAGLLTGEALSVPYYRNAEMQRWVDDVLVSEGVENVVVFSSTMAQFVSGDRYARLHRIADLCDVDSDKWRQYAEGKRAPVRWVYAREARALLACERRIAQEFDATLFVTQAEAELFRSLAPEFAAKVGAYDNGVDTDYFDPEPGFESPYADQSPVAVFTGAMDYWANVDAVTWFAAVVWPRVLARVENAKFYIVGSNPGAEVKALGNRPGIWVTGRVPDVRPYLAHADLAVAPLRIARGTQNKVLEALAMAKPIVCTSAAAAGLRIEASAGFRIEDEPSAFAAAILALFGHGPCPEGRERVTERYSWDANLRVVDELLGQRPVSQGQQLTSPASAAV